MQTRPETAALLIKEPWIQLIIYLSFLRYFKAQLNIYYVAR